MTPDPQIPPWTSVLTPSININNVHPLKEVYIFHIPILNSEKNIFSTIIEVSGTSQDPNRNRDPSTIVICSNY